MAQARPDTLNGPALDALLEAMAAASVGDLGARIPLASDADGPFATLAHALNILLADLQEREGMAALQTERLRTLLAQLPTGVIIADAPTGRVIFHNRAAERVFGKPLDAYPDLVAYSRQWPSFHEDGSPLLPGDGPLSRAVMNGETVRDKLVQVQLGDARRWLSCNAAPVLDPNGAVTGGMLVVEDVTERRESARREAEGDAFRRILLEGLGDAGIGFLVTDGRRILMVNEALGAMIGREPHDLVGTDTTALVVPEERQEGAARQDERIARRVTQTFRCTFERPDGTRVPAHVIGKPLRGEPPRFVAIIRDLTEEERARQDAEAARRQIAQSEKLSALGSLVSGVAHEVRTPLTYLQNNLFLLHRRLERALAKPDADPALRELLPDVSTTLEAADRIDRLVEDLRRYTRLRVTGSEHVSLQESVRQGLDLFRATHRGGIELQADLAPTPDVRMEALAAQQVILNLLSNAAEASSPGSVVRVRTRVEGAKAVLEVQDRGVGIPPEVVARVFDPFFTTKAQGTGLGLSIVRRIVEEAGGEIEIDSAPGVGTTFRVLLPRATGGAPSTGAGQREGI